jgi:hypothetical protein
MCDNRKIRQTGISHWSWVVVSIIVVLTAAIRLRLLAVPLERDEGEYAYAAQLILQGIPPYAQVYNMKMPGIYAAYALILAVFGQTQSGIHLGLLFINVATILVLFLLAKKLFDPLIGAAAAAAFALLSLGQPVQGIFANAEHFVILPALAGILLLVRAVGDSTSLIIDPECSRKADYYRLSLLAGAVLLGLAFLMKQHGAAFIAFTALYLFLSEIRRQPFVWRTFVVRGVLFLVGVVLPFVVTCLLLWRLGVFERFWFWTFKYARQYVAIVPFAEGLYDLKKQMMRMVNSAILLWVLAAIGLAVVLWRSRTNRHCLFVAGFLLFSFLSVCPGFYFREHYFVLLLPAVAILTGIGVASVRNLFARDKPVPAAKATQALLAGLVLFHTVYQQRDFLLNMSPTAASRSTYGSNPFPESLEIARFIKEHSTKDDRIAILGSEPQIYFYSSRRSATGYVYTYALMEPHPYALQMQQEMIREIEAARPKFLVFVKVFTSWCIKPGSEQMIFEWFEQYQQKNYSQIGIVDIISPKLTVYHLGDSDIEYSPRSEIWLSVFQRKDK